MLKKTETEEAAVFFVTFLPLIAFQLGDPGPPAPTPTLATSIYDILRLLCCSMPTVP